MRVFQFPADPAYTFALTDGHSEFDFFMDVQMCIDSCHTFACDIDTSQPAIPVGYPVDPAAVHSKDRLACHNENIERIADSRPAVTKHYVMPRHIGFSIDTSAMKRLVIPPVCDAVF